MVSNTETRFGDTHLLRFGGRSSVDGFEIIMASQDWAIGRAPPASAGPVASQSSPLKPVRVAVVNELKGAGPFALAVGGVDLVLVRGEDGWRAFEGRCPHQGALLGEGEVAGGALVCRNHRWQFSIATGQREGGPECLASYPVTERDGALWVDVAGQRSSASQVVGRSLDELPGPKPMPLIGNFLQLEVSRAHQNFEEWAARYGSTYQIWIGRRRIVASSDPKLVEQVLRARPETFRRSEALDRILGELGVHGVFNAEGAAWRSLRKLSVAALAQRNLNPLFPSIEKVAGRVKARWDRAARAGDTLDVVEELTRYTVDVTMLLIFGHDTNTVEQQGDVIQRELDVILPVINRRLFAVIPLWRFVSTPSDRRLKRALANVRTWLNGLLAQARADVEAAPAPAAQGRSVNVVKAMVIASDENGAPFSDDAIISNLLTMLIAGEDTTAFTLSWAIHELCDSPQWTEELRHEADDILGASAVAKSAEDVNLLARAGAVANETMRLRPVGPLSFLDANVDALLGDYVVPKNTTISVLLRPAAVDPANFYDPTAFRPERWLDHPIAPHNTSACMPFGSGPRMCPGRSLASLEMKAFLAMLYKNFDVERVGESASVSERYNGFTMAPAGLKVRLRARADSSVRA